jgi:hypothetical protein
VWIWIWVAIIVVSLGVQAILGRRIWRAVKELMVQVRELETTSAVLGLELSRVGTAPAVEGPPTPRHGMNLATQA